MEEKHYIPPRSKPLSNFDDFWTPWEDKEEPPTGQGIPLITKPAPAIMITITPETEPKIYEALTAAAREERRTPDAQALHWLENAALEWVEWKSWQATPPKPQNKPEPSK
jgi:hypothetical protein